MPGPRKGYLKLKNPQKYRGDPTNVVYRSSWELKLYDRLDKDPNVLEWNSEEIVVPYRDKSSGRMRRYFPDAWLKRRGRDGQIEEFLLEVKPAKESRPPTRQGKTEKRFITECLLWAKNSSKFDAAKRYCSARGWTFKVITEKELGV
jgi:hypothetical protein